MPLDNQTRQAITNTQNRFQQTVERIRTDITLSAHGKADAIAREYGNARDEIARLRARAGDDYQTRTKQLEDKLFSLGRNADPSEIIAYRDALDRASELTTPSDAAQLMQRALRSGDRTLAKAVFSAAFHAIQNDGMRRDAWRDSVESYLADNPTLRDAADELAQLYNSNTRETRLMESVTTSLAAPTEIQHYNDVMISQAQRGIQQPA